MKRILLTIVIIAACLAGEKAMAASRLHVIDLTCENLHNPLGIDTATPRLSWKLASSRQGDSQTAYEIEVASSEALLTAGEADLWRSGRVASAQSVLVAYGGKALHPRDVAYWRVRPYDVKGKPSEWSEVALFGVGFVEGTQMEGRYIAMSAENPDRKAMVWPLPT